MRVEKRQWVYQGLGVPEGVGLVRRPSSRRLTDSAMTRRLLLCGEQLVKEILPPLARLASDGGMSIHVDARPGKSAHEWAKQGWLRAHLVTFQPTVVLLALDPRDLLARRLIDLRIARAGADLLWVVPHEIECPQEIGFFAAPSSSVTAMAGWVGRLWADIKLIDGVAVRRKSRCRS